MCIQSMRSAVVCTLHYFCVWSDTCRTRIFTTEAMYQGKPSILLGETWHSQNTFSGQMMLTAGGLRSTSCWRSWLPWMEPCVWCQVHIDGSNVHPTCWRQILRGEREMLDRWMVPAVIHASSCICCYFKQATWIICSFSNFDAFCKRLSHICIGFFKQVCTLTASCPVEDTGRSLIGCTSTLFVPSLQDGMQVLFATFLNSCWV